MSVEYKYTSTKNHRSRIVTNEVCAGDYVTSTRGREDNAQFALRSGANGQQLYIRVPRADGTGLDEVVLNGRQIRTLVRVFDRHNNG